MPPEGLLPGWPGVAVIALLILRDEIRARRIARELADAGRRLERSTVIVRADDPPGAAAARGPARRRRRTDRGADLG